MLYLYQIEHVRWLPDPNEMPKTWNLSYGLIPVLLYLAHSNYFLSKTIGLWDQNRDADGNVLINYDFALGNNFSDDFKTLFTDAVEWFHRETCLRFVEIEPSDDADFLGPVFTKLNRFLILVHLLDL